MNVWEEIEAMRTELSAADRTVQRLASRLDDIEAYQRRAEQTEGAKTSPVPPPLPKATPNRPQQAPIQEVTPPERENTPAAPPPWTKPVVGTKKIRRFGPPEGMSWEMALTTYWAPRIGIPLIAAAVVFILTYISSTYQDAAWMPYARVGAGLALAGALIGIGWKLEKKYANYARLLMGGGFGVLYFVIFATWYIPQTRIAPSQGLTLFLLAVLVAGWGAIAQWRQSSTVALFMAFMGHFTVALSTLTLADPSRAAIGGLFLLGAGSAWFLCRNGWYSVALTAMVGSYLNQFLWLTQAPAGGNAPEFIGGMVVLSGYLLLYAAAERVTPVVFAANRQRIRNIYCTANTGGFLLLALVLLQGFGFARPYDYLLYFATAGFGLAMGWSYTRRLDPALLPGFNAAQSAAPSKNALGDPLSAVYFTKASALVALGFAAWLDGPTVTLSLAIESLILLFAAQRSHRPVGRLLSIGTAALAFLHAIYTWSEGAWPGFGEAGYTGYLFATLATVTAFYLAAELYRLTPWQTFGTRPYTGPQAFAALCRDLEMLPNPDGTQPLPSRMALSHLYVAFGVLVLLGNCANLMDTHFAAAVVGVLSTLTVLAGLWRCSVPVLSGAALLSGASALWWIQFVYGPEEAAGNTLLLACTVLGSLLLSSEFIRCWASERLRPFARNADIQGAWFGNAALISVLFATTGALVTGTTAAERMAPGTGLMALGLLALAASGYAACFAARNLGAFSICLILFSVISAASRTGSPWTAFAGIVLLAVAATATERRYWGDRDGLFFHRLLPMPYVLYGIVAWNALWFIHWQAADTSQPAIIAVLAAGLWVAMFVLHPRAMAATGTALFVVATIFWMTVERVNPPLDTWHGSAVVLLCLAIGGDRYLAWRKPFAQPWPGRLLMLCAWGVALTYNLEVSEGGWYDAGLAIIAIAFLAYAALIRSGTAAMISGVTAALGSLPLLVNPTSVVTLVQVTASMAGDVPSSYQTKWGHFLAYTCFILYWACAERAAFITLARTQFKLREGHEPLVGCVLTALPALLGVLLIARIDPIHDFYLTLSWSVWALAIFGWAIVTKQRWYRYIGLATIGLALGRALFIDIWKLDGLYRAGAMLVLGVVLLSVAYGYTRWRASQLEETGDGEDNQRDG